MDFDWGSIRAEIKSYCINAFKEINYQTDNIEGKIDEALTVYKNIIDIEPSYFNLQLYGDKARKALQDAFIDCPGTIASLGCVANCADSFLKLLLTYSRKKTYNSVMNETLKPLAEMTGAFGDTVQSLKNVDPETVKNNQNNLYLLAVSYEARNIHTHNSPGWDRALVYVKLKFLMAFEIYCIIHLENDLKNNMPKLYVANEGTNLSTIDFRAYDLLNFGKSSGELKNRIMQGVILHHVLSGPRSETEIKEELTDKLNINSVSSCKRAINRLVRDARIIQEQPSGKYVLTETEILRLNNLNTDYKTNTSLLLSSIEKILKDTPLENSQIEVYEQTGDFLEAYIQKNLVIELIDSLDFNEENSLFLFIKDAVDDEENAKELTRKIIRACTENTVLWRSSIGKVYTSMVNEFAGPSQCQRDLFIDTQIALYLLCMPYPDFPAPDITLFKTCHELKLEVDKSQEMILKCLRIYIPEIAYHLKGALRMVFLEDYPAFKRTIPTNNVFYRYYKEAKMNNLLPESIDSFASFLEEILSVTKEDLDRENLDSILHARIEEALEDMGIKVESKGFYDDHDFRRERNCFESIVRTNTIPKSMTALKNDSIMAHYLFDNETVPPSIFITLDKSFSLFRSKYIADYYKGDNSAHWLLFSPSRIINHIDLLKMKFDPVRLSDGLMTIITDKDDTENTKSIFEYVQHITELKGIGQNGIKRRQKALMAKFYNKEFEEISEYDMPDEKYLTAFEDAWNRVLERYNHTEPLRQRYAAGLRKDAIFDSLIQMIDEFVKNAIPDIDAFTRQTDALFTDGNEDTKNINYNPSSFDKT